MSDTAENVAAAGPITTIHLILIVILAVLTVLAIVYGVARKRQRKSSIAETHEHREIAEEVRAEAHPEATVAPPPPAPIPLAPAPPPLDSGSVVATPVETPVPAAARIAEDLSTLKGLGPKLVARLGELGITRIDQIAALSPTEADALDDQLDAFKGRMARDKWIEQAKLLSAGDKAGYEAAFGKLGG